MGTRTLNQFTPESQELIKKLEVLLLASRKYTAKELQSKHLEFFPLEDTNEFDRIQNIAQAMVGLDDYIPKHIIEEVEKRISAGAERLGTPLELNKDIRNTPPLELTKELQECGALEVFRELLEKYRSGIFQAGILGLAEDAAAVGVIETPEQRAAAERRYSDAEDARRGAEKESQRVAQEGRVFKERAKPLQTGFEKLRESRGEPTRGKGK